MGGSAGELVSGSVGGSVGGLINYRWVDQLASEWIGTVGGWVVVRRASYSAWLGSAASA